MNLLEVTERFVLGNKKPNIDFGRREKLLFQANAEISEHYERGTLKWIESNRPDLSQKIKQATDAVDKTWLGDGENFRAALDEYVKAYLEAIRLFKAAKSNSQAKNRSSSGT